jgi:DNA-binding transcriptional MerR regulator
MTDLIKSNELSTQYGVSTRTLRYYEEMGLIESRRVPDYPYRMYDEANIKRLEQIIILRKLNIGIKDIKRIFTTAGTEVVLEVLGKKAADIDEEVALLQELKEIVLTFIRQIEQSDFNRDADVKWLYDKAKEIEIKITGAEYNGNPGRMGEQDAQRPTSPGRMGEQDAQRPTSPGRMGEQDAQRPTSPGRMGEQDAQRPTSPGSVNRLMEVTGRLAEKAVSRLQIPDNIIKRMLQNVYFILGDGAEAADELGRRHNIFVYHTCDYRYAHSQNADPRFQPTLSRANDAPDFFTRDPADAFRHENEVVHDFTPMVIMDLIRLTAAHDKIICENDIDIENILDVVTHAVMVTNPASWDNFICQYENAIRRRDIPEIEKDEQIDKLRAVWGKGKPENPRDFSAYGIKRIIMDENSETAKIADEIAGYFGWE